MAVPGRIRALSGFPLRGPGEPSLYWAGDTVWCPELAAVLVLEA